MRLEHHILLTCFCIFLGVFATCKVKAQQFAHHKSEKLNAERSNCVIKPNDIAEFLEVLKNTTLEKYISSIHHEFGVVIVRMTEQERQGIASLIKAYDIRNEIPNEESFLSDYFPEVNAIQAAKQKYPEYFLIEDTISVKENDIPTADIDLINRNLTSNLSSGETKIHAADMATIIAGNGNTFYSSEGIQSQAFISTTSFLNLLPDTIEYFRQNHIRIQNHSYGLNVEDYYGIEAQAYDQQTFDHPEILHIFSSGNLGQESSIFSDYAEIGNYSNLTGTFKHAKNVLTIGAIDSSSNYIAKSSVGPAYDGRIKPELVAYGYKGTSDAAAITTGCAATIRGALLQSNFTAPASLIKAILIAGAEDVEEEGIDFKTGFGKVNLLNSLSIVKNERFIIDRIVDSEIKEFKVNVSGNGARFVLAWTDPPGQIDNENALINDLDITIVKSDGSTFLPFQVKYLPEEIMAGLTTSRGRDSINNVELITITEPGDYTVKISAYDLQVPGQDFSIAFIYDLDKEFNFAFPYHGSNLEPNQRYDVILNTNSAEQIVDMEFDGQVDYEYPEKLSYFAEIAEVNGSAVSSIGRLAEVYFTVTSIPEVEVVWRCDDVLELGWNVITGSETYEVLKLIDDEFVVLDSTKNSFYTLEHEKDSHYAIRRKIGPEIYGPQSLIINPDEVNSNCFYDIFSGSIDKDDIILQVELIVNSKPNDIHIEKWIGGDWVIIGELSTEETSQSLIDSDPLIGTNLYRLAFNRNNVEYYSEELEIFYVPENEVLVLPNLTTAGIGIDIVQGSFTRLDIVVYDLQGRLIHRESLLSEFEFLTLDDYPSGIYFYTLLSDGTPIQSGKLAVFSK